MVINDFSEGFNNFIAFNIALLLCCFLATLLLKIQVFDMLPCNCCMLRVNEKEDQSFLQSGLSFKLQSRLSFCRILITNEHMNT